ncbi:DUF3726 domain-containing protein [Roseovarius salinarum]|uniref:DUF3726 domain-containing protein n=1 Tax=Roseovarius salinarum TaxID=1981892 RepID=UPI000C32A781|nr:DUF3726 domain-containing protein [Roseovarius salinarum]
MSHSLYEVEALARRAARGAGLSWGLAEEAGRSTRWLAAAGLPGPEALADWLSRSEGLPHDLLCPADVGATWTARGGTLCPLIAGAALSDMAAELAARGGVTLGPTGAPLLMLPFVAAAARAGGAALAVEWAGLSAHFGERVSLRATDAGLHAAQATGIRVARRVHPPGGACAVRPGSRGHIPPRAAETLDAFAHRTYAPATPESRLGGAGAGLTDND